MRIAESEELRRLRDEKLRLLDGCEVFSAGAALLTERDGRPDPRPAIVVVTDADLVLLDADPLAPEEEIARIPRAQVTGIRLLDENGEKVTQPPSEVEELDVSDRRCGSRARLPEAAARVSRNPPGGRCFPPTW